MLSLTPYINSQVELHTTSPFVHFFLLIMTTPSINGEPALAPKLSQYCAPKWLLSITVDISSKHTDSQFGSRKLNCVHGNPNGWTSELYVLLDSANVITVAYRDSICLDGIAERDTFSILLQEGRRGSPPMWSIVIGNCRFVVISKSKQRFTPG